MATRTGRIYVVGQGKTGSAKAYIGEMERLRAECDKWAAEALRLKDINVMLLEALKP